MKLFRTLIHNFSENAKVLADAKYFSLHGKFNKLSFVDFDVREDNLILIYEEVVEHDHPHKIVLSFKVEDLEIKLNSETNA